MLCDTHHLKTILSKTTVGWVKKKGWREWKWNWNGNESENEKWRMENENESVNDSERKISMKGDKWKRWLVKLIHMHSHTVVQKHKQITHPPSPPHNHVLTIKDSKKQ